MQLPESSLVAAVDRMSRALEQLASAPRESAVVEELLRSAGATVGTARASLCWWEESGVLRSRTTEDVPAEAAEACALWLLRRWQGLEEAPGAYAAPDLARDALLADAPGARQSLGGAVLALPVFLPYRGDAVGVLAAYFPAPRPFSEEDLKRFGLYARLASVALERERLAESTRLAALQARAEVEQAEIARLTRFQTVTEAFSRALTREEVSRVVLDLGIPAVGALSGTVHLVPDGGGGPVELVAAVGVPAESQEPVRRLPRGGEGLPGYDTVRSGMPVWLESMSEAEARFPRFAAMVEGQPRRSFAFLPLQVEARVFGVLGFGFAEERRFSALDRASLVGLARQCGQALERARLYERERATRLQAEAAGQRLRLLADASALLSSSLEWEETVAGVARLALGTLADWCAVDATVDGSSEVRRLAVLHADPDKAAHAQELMRWRPEDGRPTSLAEVLRTGRSRMMARVGPELVDERMGDPALKRAALALGMGSIIQAPLVARQRTLGVLTFVRGEGQPPYDATDLALAEELAARAGLAIDNARLFRQARAAEDESRRSAARLHVLVQVSQLIAEAGLDLSQVLDVLARKVSEAIGDACVLQLLADDREHLALVAVHHPDAEARAVLEQALRERPSQLGTGLGGRVAGTGQSLSLPRLTAEDLRQEQFAEGVPYFERYGAQSLLIVPLGARGRVLGTLGVMREAPGREYSAEERALLESLAARAALAIEDARAYGAATEAVKARDELLSVAGHELKTPLNALQLQIQLLARMARDAMAAGGLAERAERAERAGQRLGLLIDDLMDVSRISAGRLRLQREELDLAGLTRETAARMSEELARAGCELRLAADAAVLGRWDRLRLEQVLVNLLSNAAKYGAGHPVSVAVELAEARCRVTVRDEGIGIAPEDHERIFERFERTAAAQHFKGLGLGLWITRRIVEALGGTIRVQSQQGQGSTFTVELPLSAPEE